VRSLDRAQGRERLAYPSDHGRRVLEEFAPGEVNDLIADIAKLLVSFKLPDSAAGVGVPHLTVRLRGYAVPGPVEIDVVTEIRAELGG